MFPSKLFAYTDGVMERAPQGEQPRRPSPVLARAAGVLNSWTRDAFNPRYPQLSRRS